MSVGGSGSVSPARVRAVTALIFFAFALNLMDRMLLAVLMEPIKRDLGLSDTQLGLLTGFAFVAVYALFGVFVARLADRFGRRLVLAGSIVLWSVMTALCGAANSFGYLVFARLGVGAGESGCIPASFALVGDLYPPQKRMFPMALTALGSTTGIAIGLSIGGIVAATWGWRWAFVLAGLPGIILALLVIRLVPDNIPPRPAETGKTSETTIAAIRILLSNDTYRWLVIAFASFAFISSGVVAWLPSFFVRSHHLPIAQAGAFFGLSFASGCALGTVGGAWLFEAVLKYHPEKALGVMGLALFLDLPLLLASLHLDNVRIALGLMLPYGVITGMATGPFAAMLQNSARQDLRALAAALANFMGAYFGWGLCGLVIGWASDMLAPRYGADALRYALSGSAMLIPLCASCMIVAARRARAAIPPELAQPI